MVAPAPRSRVRIVIVRLPRRLGRRGPAPAPSRFGRIRADALLIRLGATPIPDSLPSPGEIWDAVRSPDDGTLALAGFTLAAWLSWAVISISVLLEIAAKARGAHAPALPGLAWPQHLARHLVGAAALLFLTVPAAAAAGPAPLLTAAPPPNAASSLAASVPVNPQAPTSAATTREDLVEYRVLLGDTLWQIAERHLGDGAEYQRIVEFNRAAIGDDPGFLTPGTRLWLPASYYVQPGDTLTGIAADELGDADAYRELADLNNIEDPDVIDVGEVLTLPETSSPPPLPPGEGQHDAAHPERTPRDRTLTEHRDLSPVYVSPAPEQSMAAVAATRPAPADRPTGRPGTGDQLDAGGARGQEPERVLAESEESPISTRTLIGLAGGGGLLAAPRAQRKGWGRTGVRRGGACSGPPGRSGPTVVNGLESGTKLAT